uniref:Transcriptional activator protein n=1 Tax=Tomato leaf curl Dharwad virus TaxID=406088 RepID=Q000R5_9GEMI|nr:transcriptional activator protein [Tomato leaf curl Dharwad virus]
MQNSSPSTSHYTQVPIKVQHKIAKKRSIRRKRIDLPCGCSYYLHINCHIHGFTHRGTHHCSSSDEWRVYLQGSKSPLFQDHKAPQAPVQLQPRHHSSPDTVQSQPEESIGDTQMLPGLHSFHSLTTSDLAFLEGI